MQSTILGVDLARTVFQVSIADAQRRVLQRHRLSRAQFQRLLLHTPPARVVMEGCASAHHWARLASQHGHNVKLLHARYVPAYVRRNKTDAADADALIRAEADSDLLPIPVKSEHQQAVQSLHRIRAQWQSTRVSRINEARSLLAEFGLVLPRGASGIAQRIHALIDKVPDALLGAKRAHARGQSLNELQRWALATQQRVGHNKAAVALANKMARILWAVWTRDQSFDGDRAGRHR